MHSVQSVNEKQKEHFVLIYKLSKICNECILEHRFDPTRELIYFPLMKNELKYLNIF